MKVRFCLDRVLHEHDDFGHGCIERISRHADLERHRVSAMLKGSPNKISLDALAGICRYLIEKHQMNPRDLFNQLFALEPNQFLSFLRGHSRVTTCFGVRRGRADPKGRLAHGADTYLHGVLLEALFRAGGPAKSPSKPQASAEIRDFHQQLVQAFQRPINSSDPGIATQLQSIQTQAAAIDQNIHGKPNLAHHLSLILGSVKSNPLCELIIARCFGAEPWEPHGAPAVAVVSRLVDSPTERAVPFFLRYRDGEVVDPEVPSCHGGLKLAKRKVSCGDNCSVPGVYFEQDDGTWECFPCSDLEDAAVVFYEEDRDQDTARVVLGGFSSNGTLALAMKFDQITDQIWPPAYESQTRRVGVFVVRFEFESEEQAAPTDVGLAHLPALAAPPKVVSLSEKVLKRRLERK